MSSSSSPPFFFSSTTRTSNYQSRNTSFLVNVFCIYCYSHRSLFESNLKAVTARLFIIFFFFLLLLFHMQPPYPSSFDVAWSVSTTMTIISVVEIQTMKKCVYLSLIFRIFTVVSLVLLFIFNVKVLEKKSVYLIFWFIIYLADNIESIKIKKKITKYLLLIDRFWLEQFSILLCVHYPQTNRVPKR